MRTIDCERCHGRGRAIEEGFDGRTAVDCTECKGTGEIELTEDEATILDAFLVGCREALWCDECGQPRDLHDDGRCAEIVPFPTTGAPRPAA
jgi:hypothetical protein